jgi:hypothetical protein
MLNLKHGRAMEYLNLNHSQKMDIITYINYIITQGTKQHTISILIESHFICAYRLVSIAHPYNTNRQEPSEFDMWKK